MNSETIESILAEAKKCPVKGRLYVYERFKKRLLDLDLSSDDYTQACRELANLLEV